MARQSVLVIEDEAGVRHLVARALEDAYTVHQAAEGTEGLRLARHVQPAIILLDLRLPGLDGLGVLARLKAHPATEQVPVVIVSVDGETDTVFEAQQAGAADHLIKPFDVIQLRQVVERNILLEPPEPRADPVRLTDAVEPVRASPRVLVVDDEDGIRKLMRRALEPTYEVHEAADGEQGIWQARHVKPHLIFLDLRLPGIDGLGVLARLKAASETAAIPVVVVSVRGEAETLMEEQDTGAADHLIKPFTVEALRTMAQRYASVPDA